METKNITRTVGLYSNLLMITTSVHHIYGAIIYNTPWRLHVLMLSLPVILATVLLGRMTDRKFLFWIYWLIIFICSFALIGLFEGVYNHFAKDLLYFLGLNRDTFQVLFPPPTYEMPNDFLFELTGVAQAVLAVPLGVWLWRGVRR